MIAYKGFQKDLKCRGFQFQEYGINETEKANCRQNGFHCAENPLDCLCYYPNWKNSVYYIVMHQGIWMKMEKIQKSPAQRCAY